MQAGSMMVAGLGKLEVPLDPAKSTFLTSPPTLATQLEQAWRYVGFKRSLTARNLGTHALGSHRRLQPIARDRRQVAARSARRLRQLAKHSDKAGCI